MPAKRLKFQAPAVLRFDHVTAFILAPPHTTSSTNPGRIPQSPRVGKRPQLFPVSNSAVTFRRALTPPTISVALLPGRIPLPICSPQIQSTLSTIPPTANHLPRPFRFKIRSPLTTANPDTRPSYFAYPFFFIPQSAPTSSTTHYSSYFSSPSSFLPFVFFFFFCFGLRFFFFPSHVDRRAAHNPETNALGDSPFAAAPIAGAPFTGPLIWPPRFLLRRPQIHKYSPSVPKIFCTQ